MSSILGESNSLSLTENKSAVVLSTKFHIKAYIFLFLVLFQVVVLPVLVSFLKLENGQYIAGASFALSAVVAFTYRKTYSFSKQQDRLEITINTVGLRSRRNIAYRNIKSVLVRTTNRPIAGIQWPVGAERYELRLVLDSEKQRFLDRSSDYIDIYAPALLISRITGAPLNEQG